MKIINKLLCILGKGSVTIHGSVYKKYLFPRRLTLSDAVSPIATKYLLAFRVNKKKNRDHYHWMKDSRNEMHPLLACKDGYISTNHHPYESMLHYSLYNIVGEIRHDNVGGGK